MHRKKGADLELKYILAKLNNAPCAVVPTSYSSLDILKAKSVLDRLLKQPTRNEVSYIKEVPTELEELEETTEAESEELEELYNAGI